MGSESIPGSGAEITLSCTSERKSSTDELRCAPASDRCSTCCCCCCCCWPVPDAFGAADEEEEAEEDDGDDDEDELETWCWLLFIAWGAFLEWFAASFAAVASEPAPAPEDDEDGGFICPDDDDDDDWWWWCCC